MKRGRVDAALVARGLAVSRTQAQAMILAGEVFAASRRIEKAGELVGDDDVLRVTPRRRFVSRGGDKLEGALVDFAPHFDDLRGRVALDVGASTGGFTDCLLQRGADHVVAVDVGYGQLDGRLRADDRVTVLERTNARDMTPQMVGGRGAPSLVVVDASFIGLEKLIDAIAGVLGPGGDLVALVKPQFQAGREAVTKGRGVIRDEGIRSAVIRSTEDEIVRRGFEKRAEADSRVVGPKGNRERFLWLRKVG